MEENPKKEIMLDPRWAFMEDGNGYMVLVLGGVPKMSDEGTEIVVFTIKPDETVRKRYNLRRGIELDDNGNMELTCAQIDLIPINMYDDANKKWLYVKSFNHDDTELSRREQNLKIKINSYRQQTLTLQAENIRLNEQLDLAKTNPAKFIKQYTEVFQESAKAVAEISKRSKED